MTTERRQGDRRVSDQPRDGIDRRQHDRRADGSVQHRANVQWWLKQMEPAPRVPVARLSALDPFCIEAAATARGSRAVA